MDSAAGDPHMIDTGYGAPLSRREDARLVSGAGRFTADLLPDGLSHAVFVRSPQAHARIERINVSLAKAAPGVIAIVTAHELAADGVSAIESPVDLKRPDGSKAPSTPRPLLAGEVVRHVGEPVAMVIATSAAAAMDAAERIDVDYATLPSVTTCRAALATGASAARSDVADNIAFAWRHGDHDGVVRALAAAAHVARLEYGVTRVAAAPMEPRVTLAQPTDAGRMLVHASTQNPYQLRDGLAKLFGLAPGAIRVVAGDVGGSFGMKAGVSREDALVFWAAR